MPDNTVSIFTSSNWNPIDITDLLLLSVKQKRNEIVNYQNKNSVSASNPTPTCSHNKQSNQATAHKGLQWRQNILSLIWGIGFPVHCF